MSGNYYRLDAPYCRPTSTSPTARRNKGISVAAWLSDRETGGCFLGWAHPARLTPHASLSHSPYPSETRAKPPPVPRPPAWTGSPTGRERRVETEHETRHERRVTDVNELSSFPTAFMFCLPPFPSPSGHGTVVKWPGNGLNSWIQRKEIGDRK